MNLSTWSFDEISKFLGEDQVTCSLEIVEDFETGPAYHALSYCWGDANDVFELLCNQQSIHVTRNLYEALHKLRSKGQELAIWADAVCIEQKNITERNQQVSIIDRIYANASRVYIWLGYGDSSTTQAIRMIHTLVQRMHATIGPQDEICP